MSKLFPESEIFKHKKGKVAKVLSDYEKAVGIVKKTPEALIKLDSASKGLKTKQHIMKAATYIARHCKIAVENEKGDILSIEELKETVESWALDQDIPEDNEGLAKQNRAADARKVVISCPKGTDPEALRNAARQFGEEFLKKEGFEYMFAVHYKSKDTPKEPEHPHAHFLIKSISSKDKRLNIRKDDLKLMRERFAVIAKQYGIELNATSRGVRGKIFKSMKLEQIHQQKRGSKHAYDYARENEIIAALRNNSTLKDHPLLTKAKITRKNILLNAEDFIKQLSSTGKNEDIILANKLKNTYQEIAKQPIESKQQLKLRIARRITQEKQKQQSQAQKWAIDRKKKLLKEKSKDR